MFKKIQNTLNWETHWAKWMQEGKEQKKGVERGLEIVEEEEGRAWETSANSKLVTLKMLWAIASAVTVYECVCAIEYMSKSGTENT